MNVAALVNPAAGDGDGRDLAREFADRVGGATVRITDGPADLPRLARGLADRDPDLLAVVGGDGTLRETVDALGGNAPPLFVVPAGRGNSSYRHLYGDADWRALADRLDDFAVRRVDVGRVASDAVTGRFVLGYSAGFFRETVVAAEPFGALPGPLAYLLGAVRAVRRSEPLDIAVRADDWRFEGPARLVAVGGGRYRGNAFELFPKSRPADGSLHVLVVEPTGVRDALAVARRALSGDHATHPAVHYRRTEAVTVTADALPAEVDGAALPPCPRAELEVLPGALPLAVPSSAPETVEGCDPRDSPR